MVAPGSKMPLCQGFLGLNHRNTKKPIQKSSSAEMDGSDVHEIWYVAWPNGSLPSLFKWWPPCPKWPLTRVLGLNHKKT